MIGIEWVDGLSDRFKDASIQLGLWLVNACELINNGSYDTVIETLALYMRSKDIASGRSVKEGCSNNFFYLRIGYEFDSALNGYDPVQYKAAFTRIVKAFKRLNVTNCAFVWHSSGEEPRDAIVRSMQVVSHSSTYLSIYNLHI